MDIEDRLHRAAGNTGFYVSPEGRYADIRQTWGGTRARVYNGELLLFDATGPEAVNALVATFGPLGELLISPASEVGVYRLKD